MTKYANLPEALFKTPLLEGDPRPMSAEFAQILRESLFSDNIPDGNQFQRTKASNLLASDIPTNSDFEEFNDTGVVAYAWEGQWDDAGTTTLTRDFYRPSTSAFRGSKCQMLISPDNVRGSSIASQPFAVKPFLQWHPSVWAKSDAALPAGAKGFRCRIAWFNGNSDFSKAGVASFTDVVLGADTTLSTAFQEFAADVTVPASARFARFILYNHGPSKGSNFASNILVDTTSWGLKAINRLNSITGTTVNPNTSSGAFAVIPEMTITDTFSGSPVIIEFSMNVQCTIAPGGVVTSFQINLGIFRDGAQIGTTYTQAWQNILTNNIVSFGHIDQPSAGSHTYDIRWLSVDGGTYQAFGTTRELQTCQFP